MLDGGLFGVFWDTFAVTPTALAIRPGDGGAERDEDEGAAAMVIVPTLLVLLIDEARTLRRLTVAPAPA